MASSNGWLGLILLAICALSARAAATPDCGTGWSALGSNCYYVNSTADLTWHEANQWCISQNGDLASVLSRSEQQFLVQHRLGLGQVWLGLHNRDSMNAGKYVWSDGSAVSYTNWEHATSPGGAAFETCADIGSTGYWEASDCSLELGVACKRPASKPLPQPHGNHSLDNITVSTRCGGWYEHSGFCYGYFSRRVRWLDARSNCQKKGGYIIDILSAHELEFVSAFARKLHTRSFWMGLNSRLNGSEFVWDDGTVGGHALTTNAKALNWGRGEPNSRFGYEYCTETQYPTLVWNDLTCRTYRSYVCKRRMRTDANYTDITPPQLTSCPANSRTFKHPNGAIYCYNYYGSSYSYRTRKSWVDAVAACQQKGQTLVSISDHWENDFIRQHVMTSGYGYVWIGLSNYNTPYSFQWSDGSPLSFLHLLWLRYLYSSSRRCISMSRYSTHWSIFSCSSRNKYICKTVLKPPNLAGPKPAVGKYCSAGWRLRDGFCYYINPSAVAGRQAAADACAARSAKLTSIHSRQEHAFLSSLLALQAKQVDAFIGLTDLKEEGEYLWDDGSLVSFTYWNSRQPNDHNHNQDCVKLYQYRSTWNDVDCNSTLSYICKKPADQTTAPSQSIDKKCPAGWAQFNTKCLKVMPSAHSFAAAQTSCSVFVAKNGRKGSLAAVSTRADTFMLSSLALREQQQGQLWTGLNDRSEEGVYQWTSKQPITFVNWASGQPSEHRINITGHGTKNCVSMDAGTSRWQDRDCSTALPYFCMMDDTDTPVPSPKPTHPSGSTADCAPGWLKYNGICYGFFGTITNATMNMASPVIVPQSWQDSERICQQRGGHLASVHEDDTQEFLATTFHDTLQAGVLAYWVGLSQAGLTKGAYQWTDGSPVDYTHWAFSEPNDRHGNEDCVEVLLIGEKYGYFKQWSDHRCASKRAFVCAINAGQPFMNPTVAPTPPIQTGLTKLDCPDDWITTDGRCFKLSSKPLTWSFAKRKCEAIPPPVNGAKVSLASIHNTEQHITVAKAIMAASVIMDNVTRYWIGLNDRGNESHFSWADSSPVDYLPWSIGEPNNYARHQDCGELKGAYGYLLNDDLCSKQLYYVCSYGRYIETPAPKPTCAPGVPCQTKCPEGWSHYESSCYYRVDTKMDFSDAYTNCSQYSPPNSDMLGIENAAENKWVTQTFLSGDEFYWIGYSDEDQEGVWRWASGSHSSYTNWHTGQPNDYASRGGEDCAASHGESGGKWFDRPCDSYLRFVCEMPVQYVAEQTASAAPSTTTASATYTTTGTSTPSTAGRSNQHGSGGGHGLSSVATGLIGALVVLALVGIIGVVVFLALRRRQRINSGLAGPVGFRRLNDTEDTDDDDNLLVE